MFCGLWNVTWLSVDIVWVDVVIDGEVLLEAQVRDASRLTLAVSLGSDTSLCDSTCFNWVMQGQLTWLKTLLNRKQISVGFSQEVDGNVNDTFLHIYLKSIFNLFYSA